MNGHEVVFVTPHDFVPHVAITENRARQDGGIYALGMAANGVRVAACEGLRRGKPVADVS